MSNTLRIGMIGCGEIAYKATGQSVADCPNAVIVAAMDTVADVARSFADKFGGEPPTDAAALMARDDVDAVLISAPHFLHAPLTTQAAEAGKHVLVEKPIACTTEQANDMIAACADAGVLLSVLLPSRYSGSTVRAKELIEAGALGADPGHQVPCRGEQTGQLLDRWVHPASGDRLAQVEGGLRRRHPHHEPGS